MYSSPCLDHQNCPLDLTKLRAAIRLSRTGDHARWSRLTHTIDDCEALTKALTLTLAKCAPGTVDHAAAKEKLKSLDAEASAARRDRRELNRVCSPENRTLLYSIRAHHRGRVHRTKLRQPTGEIVTLGLEDQEEFIACHGGWDEFRKSAPEKLAS